jgi:hypothetical protein
MHSIEPFYNWQKYYLCYEDKKSPYFEHIPDGNFNHTVYEYYLHPDWDDMGSETLYLKILMVNYKLNYMVIELIGEWNDTLHNDVMYLKRGIIDHFLKKGIQKFILIGENVFQFHGSDDEYYTEWLEDAEEGWIVAVGFRDFVHKEWKRYGVDAIFNYGGNLEIDNWRTLKPDQLYERADLELRRRLG